MLTDRRRFLAIVALAAVSAAGILVPGLGHMAAQPLKIVATSARTGPIALKSGPVTVMVAPPAGSAATLAALPPGRQISLIGTGLRTNEQPEVLYEVYLGLPSGAAATRDSIHFVGTFNFFSANASAATDRPALFTYDVTDLVASLRARKLLGDAVSVTIVPAGKPNDAARPIIGEIALVLD